MLKQWERYKINLSMKKITILLVSILFLQMNPAHSGNDITSLKRVFSKLIAGMGEKESDYTLEVVESEEINAYATLGNKMVVNTALLKSINSEAGLAFVLAHELGHIEHHHVHKSILVSAVSALFGNLFFKADTTSSKIYNGASYFHNLSYSRGKEKDADLFAVTLVDKFYCKDPNKLEFFRRNSGVQKSGKLLEYFSTHPLTSTRLAYLDEAFTAEKCVF